jgi:hypothetical protein
MMKNLETALLEFADAAYRVYLAGNEGPGSERQAAWDFVSDYVGQHEASAFGNLGTNLTQYVEESRTLDGECKVIDGKTYRLTEVKDAPKC